MQRTAHVEEYLKTSTPQGSIDRASDKESLHDLAWEVVRNGDCAWGTFSPTYSFDVLVEATVDAVSPCILLNLQSSALAATRPFGSQPLSAVVVE
ncbi:hypothetical protein BHM03_00032248 [Ensete ventricosum]|nr:hypothetical protein BHM03_00032248 [Ensete ventricosum]